jgi:hypothetical protein
MRRAGAHSRNACSARGRAALRSGLRGARTNRLVQDHTASRDLRFAQGEGRRCALWHRLRRPFSRASAPGCASTRLAAGPTSTRPENQAATWTRDSCLNESIDAGYACSPNETAWHLQTPGTNETRRSRCDGSAYAKRRSQRPDRRFVARSNSRTRCRPESADPPDLQRSARDLSGRDRGGAGWCPGQDSNLHGQWPGDFKSPAFTDFATRAHVRFYTVGLPDALHEAG